MESRMLLPHVLTEGRASLKPKSLSRASAHVAGPEANIPKLAGRVSTVIVPDVAQPALMALPALRSGFAEAAVELPGRVTSGGIASARWDSSLQAPSTCGARTSASPAASVLSKCRRQLKQRWQRPSRFIFVQAAILQPGVPHGRISVCPWKTMADKARLAERRGSKKQLFHLRCVACTSDCKRFNFVHDARLLFIQPRTASPARVGTAMG